MIYVVTMPGALGWLGIRGSFIRSEVKQAAEDLHLDVTFNRDRTPVVSKIRKFVKRHDQRGSRLMLCGKSLGAIKAVEKVLKPLYKDLKGYDKLALFTVDPYGCGFGKDRPKPYMDLPDALVAGNFNGVNLYHRNGGMEGAIIAGCYNIKLTTFPNGKKVRHMNIYKHPEVDDHARDLLVWLST